MRKLTKLHQHVVLLHKIRQKTEQNTWITNILSNSELYFVQTIISKHYFNQVFAFCSYTSVFAQPNGRGSKHRKLLFKRLMAIFQLCKPNIRYLNRDADSAIPSDLFFCYDRKTCLDRPVTLLLLFLREKLHVQ